MGLKVGVINYGAGNIFSVETMLMNLGVRYVVSDEPCEFEDVTHLILPGVGHFAKAMNNLREKNLVEFIKDFIVDSERSLLGICLGMQLFSLGSEEGGDTAGLGIIDGRVEKIRPRESVRVPHMGWNELSHLGDPPDMFADLIDSYTVYFNHSYALVLDETLPSVYTEYGSSRLLAAFQKANVFGFQFHPEKSQDVGKKLFKRFLAC